VWATAFPSRNRRLPASNAACAPSAGISALQMEGQQGWQRAEIATKTRKQRVTIDIDSGGTKFWKNVSEER